MTEQRPQTPLADHAAPPLSGPVIQKHLDIIRASSLDFFELMAQKHYLNKPYADKLAHEARQLLLEFIKTFSKAKEASNESIKIIQGLLSLETMVPHEDPVADILTRQIRDGYNDASRALGDASFLTEIKQRINNFCLASIEDARINLSGEIRIDVRKEGRWLLGKDFVKSIEPLQAVDPMTAAVALVTTPFIKFGALVGSRACQNKAVEARRRITFKSRDMITIEQIKEDGLNASDAVHKCEIEWANLRNRIYVSVKGSNIITSELPTDTITPDMKKQAFDLLKEIHLALHRLRIMVDDILYEVQELYGRTLRHLIDAFYDALGQLSVAMAQLETAAKIVRSKYELSLLGEVHDIADCFVTYLTYLQSGIQSWGTAVNVADPTAPLTPAFIANMTDLSRGVERFFGAMVPCDRIKRLVMEHKNPLRGHSAKGHRQEERNSNKAEERLPLATRNQVFECVAKVEHAISKTFQFANELKDGLTLFGLSGGFTVQALADGTDPTRLPANPFNIDPALIEKVSTLLQKEIAALTPIAAKKSGTAAQNNAGIVTTASGA